MVLLFLSKDIVSRLATACFLDGVNGTNPSSARGMWPPVIVSLDGVGGSIILS